jgi:hypothetical protein
LPLAFLALAGLSAAPRAAGGISQSGGPVAPFEAAQDPAVSTNHIDALVFGKLKLFNIAPANLCSDSVFVRRVYVDILGTLPTADEAAGFIADTRFDKRAALIDRLLERPEFAEYWAMKWSDILRVKAEFPVELWPNAAQAYHHWLVSAMGGNMPYSEFARALLTANGSNFRAPEVNFYRSAGSKDPKAIARLVAQIFLGERTEKWPKEKLDGFSAFFSEIGFKGTGEWKEEILYFNGFDDSVKHPACATLPDGKTVPLPPMTDPRAILTKWLIDSPDSPLAANEVNRIWYWLMGRGIIQEPDDSRPDNPPSNPELLSWLAGELVNSHYDVKHVYRLILNSNAYQLSAIPRTADANASTYFAYHPARRMEAEVIIDALNQITGSSEEYSSLVPEPFTWMPPTERAVSLPDGSITSAFLDLFGKPPRDTGLLAERNDKTTSAQRLHLLNSTHILSKINNSEKLKTIFRSAGGPQKIIQQLYLTILSRYPTDAEIKTVIDYSTNSEARNWAAWQDLAWALINSSEFCFRH